jgi:hypothetical protein
MGTSDHFRALDKVSGHVAGIEQAEKDAMKAQFDLERQMEKNNALGRIFSVMGGVKKDKQPTAAANQQEISVAAPVEGDTGLAGLIGKLLDVLKGNKQQVVVINVQQGEKEKPTSEKGAAMRELAGAVTDYHNLVAQDQAMHIQEQAAEKSQKHRQQISEAMTHKPMDSQTRQMVAAVTMSRMISGPAEFDPLQQPAHGVAQNLAAGASLAIGAHGVPKGGR